MKKIVTTTLILVLLNLWVPEACAEIYQELDPMVPIESQTPVSEETSASSAMTGQTSHTVSPAGTTTDKKKSDGAEKGKSKKSSKKKSCCKESKKSGSKKHKKSSN